MWTELVSCQEAPGYASPNGYKRSTRNGRRDYAHRHAYEEAHGAIPDGLTVDHLCRNRACVNPLHLEVVTQGENVMRGRSFAVENAQKTHCPKGHPYDEDNTFRTSGGWRGCRECRRQYHRSLRQRKRDMPIFESHK